jgi:hypothetical protein|tara:strand:- start:901 stop:1347 length:447 start_codon:yes stop_codon:yes gene_type:complete
MSVITDKTDKIMFDINAEMVDMLPDIESGRLLTVESPGWTWWVRGDGTRYKEPGKIRAQDLKGTYGDINGKVLSNKHSVLNYAWDLLKSKKGAKDIGSIRGEFGNDPYNPAIKLKGVLFINRGYAIEYGSLSRLNNYRVWHIKVPALA